MKKSQSAHMQGMGAGPRGSQYASWVLAMVWLCGELLGCKLCARGAKVLADMCVARLSHFGFKKYSACSMSPVASRYILSIVGLSILNLASWWRSCPPCTACPSPSCGSLSCQGPAQTTHNQLSLTHTISALAILILLKGTYRLVQRFNPATLTTGLSGTPLAVPDHSSQQTTLSAGPAEALEQSLEDAARAQLLIIRSRRNAITR